MTEQDYTRDAYLEDEWEDEWEDEGCILGDECLHHDPDHTSDECFNLEMAEEHMREGMRTTEDYTLGVTETVQRIVGMIEEKVKWYKVNDLRRAFAKELKSEIKRHP